MKFRILISFLWLSVMAFAQNLSSNSTGSFIYTPAAPLNNQPVEIFYHIPDGDITTMPILMAFHGASRDGDNHRDYWISMADANGFMVFAPEFTSANYPGLGDNYLMSNIFDDGDNPSPETFNNQNEWTFSLIDPLFDSIKTDISGIQETYNAWGHSGGAQFLHRFVTYLPDSNLDIAVCSNAGWYTVPETGVNFPYGIDNGQLPDTALISALSKKLIIHLGQNDNDPNSGLRRNALVDAQQGINRLERGQYYFNTSQTTAANLSATFNWEKHEVAGIGHQAQQMANDALQYVLMSTLSNNSLNKKEEFKIVPNPTNSGFTSILSSRQNPINIEVFDLLGKKVKHQILNNSELNVSDLDSGIYLIKIIQNNTSTTKKLVIQ